MTFLTTLLSSNQTPSNAFCLIQSSAAQSALPILRGIIDSQTKCSVILVCSLYAPSNLLSQRAKDARGSNMDRKVIDWTTDIPGYVDRPVNWDLRLEAVQNAIKESSKVVAVVIDSVDTLDEDIESSSKTFKFLSNVLSSITSRKDTSRLICHITVHSPVLPLLKQPRFSSSLIHLTAHPPALLTHISRTYLASPPPSSSSSSSDTTTTPDALKFWRVFVPLADNRPRDIESLIFGSTEHAEGSESAFPDELIVEVLVRGRGSDVPIFSTLPVPGPISSSGSGKRRGVERFLEGWSISKGGPVPLEELSSLKGIWRKKTFVEQEGPDPTKNLTFNLNLTDSQQASRSQVPLPYEHDGKNQPEQSQSAHIYYDPDSADDIDDEDPDEDLDL